MLRALVASGKLRGSASVLREANNEDFVPSLAYGIMGSKNDTDRIYRLLLATYHPRNLYAVYIDDADSAFALRTKLADHPVLAAAVEAAGAAEVTETGRSGEYVTLTGRIRVIEDPEIVTVEGGSRLAALLRLAHTLLRMGEAEGEAEAEAEGEGEASSSGFSPPFRLASPSWIMWLTTASNSPQREDDGSLPLSSLPLIPSLSSPPSHPLPLMPSLSSLCPLPPPLHQPATARRNYRQESVFADNALFERRRGGRWIADMRDRVTRFEVYTGSFPLLASRPFIRYLIDEPHAIPRRMLMFLGDTLSPHLHYMPTAACQAARFNHTVVNSGLHFPPFTVTQGHEMPPFNSSLWQDMTGGGRGGASGGGGGGGRDAPSNVGASLTLVNPSLWQNMTGKAASEGGASVVGGASKGGASEEGSSGGGPFLFVHDPDPGLVAKIDRCVMRCCAVSFW
ncbi:unnamed protein product [Closterium sp. Naga37s-1]|nr:unnamed protein product [Closterium sp. Naga37s-1]